MKLAFFLLQEAALPLPGEIRAKSRAILDSADYRFQAEEFSMWPWLWKKIRAFFESFEALRDGSPVVYWTVIGVLLLILAAIILHMLYVLRRSVRAAQPAAGAARTLRPKVDRPGPLLAAARDAARAGRIAEALSLWLRASILGLDQRGLLRLMETATVREYLRRLQKHPQDRALLEQFLRHYEPGVFGRAVLPAESLDECERLARRLAGDAA